MAKLIIRKGRPRKGRRLEVVFAGFVHGIGQAVTVTGGKSRYAFPEPRTPAEALKGDWDKLGGDMRQAVSKVLEGGARK